jgi:hypothetical protein
MLKHNHALAAGPRRTLKLSLAAAVLGALTACGGGDFEANIGGTVSGLATGQTLVLQNNGNDDTLVINQNGKFLFSRKLLLASTYNVTVRTPPTNQICQVSGGTGTVDNRSNDVLSVIVTCR